MESLPPTRPFHQPHTSLREQGDGESYYLGSDYSSTATESDLPGAGRTVGNFFSFLGRRLENGIVEGISIMDACTGHDPRTNNLQNGRVQQSTPVHPVQDVEGGFFVEPAHSSTATASNLPGAGRIVGNIYSHLGRYVERGASMIAVRTGNCPREVAVRTRKILQTRDTTKLSTRKAVQKRGRRLLSYTK